MSYFLGIDQGTTQTTAVLLDEKGTLIATRTAQIRTSFPRPGWVEQDPWEVLESVRQAGAPLLREYPVSAAGLDNQGESFLLWDAHTGQPLTPAIGWQDKRGLAVCQRLASMVDYGWLRRKTGLLLDTYFSGPKLRYVLDSNPDLADAARSGRALFGTTDSWVLWHLSGGRLHVTDPSTASRTLLFDIVRLGWDDDLLELFGAPRAMLPEIRPSAGHVGDLDFGTGRRVPLYALLVDQQAALFGQACFAPGQMKCTLGTGAFLLMNIGREPRLSGHGLLTTVAWQLNGDVSYAFDGGIFVAGAAVQWLAEGLHFLPDVAASAESAKRSADQEVVFVPALAGLAAPYWLPEARGAIFGLSRATTPADLVRATLEGIAYRVREVIEAMAEDAGQAPSSLRVDGGPAANSYLTQAMADLLGIEVHVAAAREATACGIADLAAHAARGITLEELAARWRAERICYPGITVAERVIRLERWQRAVAAMSRFHSPVPRSPFPPSFPAGASGA
jgi:glycerol kinase